MLFVEVNMDEMVLRKDIVGIVKLANRILKKGSKLTGPPWQKFVRENEKNVRTAIVHLSLSKDPRGVRTTLSIICDMMWKHVIWGDIDLTIDPNNPASLILSGFGSVAVDQIIDFYKENHEGRVLVEKEVLCFALGHIGDARAVPFLLKEIQQHDGGCIAAAVTWALGQIGGGPEVVDVLIKSLSDGAFHRRTYARCGLGSGRFGHAAEEALTKYLREASDRFKMSLAAVSLSMLGNPKGAEYLLENGFNHFTQTVLWIEVAKTTDEKIHQHLLEQYHVIATKTPRSESEELILRHFALALAEYRDQTAVPTLVDIIRSGDSSNENYPGKSYFSLAVRAFNTMGEKANEQLMSLSGDALLGKAAKWVLDSLENGDIRRGIEQGIV